MPIRKVKVGYEEIRVAVASVRARRALDERVLATRFVYRMEDANGRGPYRWEGWNRFKFEQRFSGETPVRDEVNPKRREDFDTEGLRKIFPEGLENSRQNPEVFYGFAHPQDCLEWFGDLGLSFLLDHDYHLTRVPAAVVFASKSGRQVAFLRADGMSERVPLPFKIAEQLSRSGAQP